MELKAIPREPLKFMLWSPFKGLILQGYVEFKIKNGKDYHPAYIQNELIKDLKIDSISSNTFNKQE